MEFSKCIVKFQQYFNPCLRSMNTIWLNIPRFEEKGKFLGFKTAPDYNLKKKQYKNQIFVLKSLEKPLPSSIAF